MNYAWPFALQGLILIGDEFFCHHRRVLRTWERRGHPVDTLSFILVLLLTFVLTPNVFNAKMFAAAAFVSCLIVTKDEWEHSELCRGFENWLHAWLFMLHPTALGWAGYLWWNGIGREALLTAIVSASIFLLYQIVYWNLWRARDR